MMISGGLGIARPLPVIGRMNEGALRAAGGARTEKDIPYNYRVAYTSYLTNGTFRSGSLDEIFGRALELYDRTRNSADDEAAKAARYADLDAAVGDQAARYVIERSAEAYANAYLQKVQENNEPTDPEARAAFHELQKMLVAGVKKLAARFGDLVKLRQLTSYAEVADMLSEDSGERADGMKRGEITAAIDNLLKSVERDAMEEVVGMADKLLRDVVSESEDAGLGRMWEDMKQRSGIYDRHGVIVRE